MRLGEEIKKEERRNHSMKNIYVRILLCRVAIKETAGQRYNSLPYSTGRP